MKQKKNGAGPAAPGKERGIGRNIQPIWGMAEIPADSGHYGYPVPYL